MPRAVERRPARHPFNYRSPWLWLLILFAGGGMGAAWFLSRPAPPMAPGPEPTPLAPAPAVVPIPRPFRGLVYPTDQTRLLEDPEKGVFQSTASGNVESGLYGSVRTANRGNGLGPSFHEGIDIACLKRDRRGQPLDEVRAVADGTVGYVCRYRGNSNYGLYVVVRHHDPLGDVYTLYAHLSAAAPGIAPGCEVKAGTVLGRMGHTPESIIPLASAHTHFELGMIANWRFDQWFRSQKLTPDHGIYNGWNLFGIDPRGVFRAHQEDPEFDFKKHLGTIGRAFEIAIPASRQLDYFRRYPGLWSGEAFVPGAIVMSCSENGVPLQGRNADERELQMLGRRQALVLSVHEEVLGRNGAHLIKRTNGTWDLARSGERWLGILTY